VGMERREALLGHLRRAAHPVTGTELASIFGVSRQVIVQDIAILRAAGAPIVATPQGYLFSPHVTTTHRAVLASKHTRDQTRDELYCLVDAGVRVVDVVVEHPLYGELRGLLMLSSRSDVDRFMAQLDASGAELLSSLTGGVHLHTIEAPSRDALENARTAMRQHGYLLEEPSAPSR